MVPSLDRYGRSLHDLITMVGDLRRREIGFTSLHERLDTTAPGGRLVFHVFAALAGFIRELIVQGTHEGLAAARAQGRVGGRPTVADAELLKAARDLLPGPDRSITSIAELLGVSVGTLYNHIPQRGHARPHEPHDVVTDLKAIAAGATSSSTAAPASSSRSWRRTCSTGCTS